MLKINKNGSLRLPFFLLRIRDFMLNNTNVSILVDQKIIR
jgi:hypothetical protein